MDFEDKIKSQREKDLEYAKAMRSGHLKIANKNEHASRLRQLLQDSLDAIKSKKTTVLLKPVSGTFGGTLPLFIDEKKLMQSLDFDFPCSVLRLNSESNEFEVEYCFGIIANENGLLFNFSDGLCSDTIARIDQPESYFTIISPCVAYVRGGE